MLLRLAVLIVFLLNFLACNRTKMTEAPVINDTGAYISATSSVLVNSANPTTGNILLDQTGGIAVTVNDGSGRIRVRLNKIIGSNEYDLYVYFNPVNAVVSHVSLSWTTDNRVTYLNAFSTSPAGVVVDLTNQTVSFTNTVLNSGLPSTANLNGQYSFVYR